MAAILKTFIYASIFIGVIFIFLPSRILAWTGVSGPAVFGWPQYAGMILGAVGAILGLWCVAAFAFIGQGTPAPFDPPRKLVVRGPYRFVRNPMYVGAYLVVAGTALYFWSLAMAVFLLVLLITSNLFVHFNEEPHLRRAFGQEYENYCKHVGRWLPSSGSSFKE